MPPDKAEQIAFGAHHSAPLELAEYWVARGYKHHGPPGLPEKPLRVRGICQKSKPGRSALRSAPSACERPRPTRHFAHDDCTGNAREAGAQMASHATD